MIFARMVSKYGLNIDKIKQAESWKQIDEELTSKVHKQYNSVVDYYNAASCLPRIQDIRVPTLVLHSRDDPIVPIECVPM